MTEKLDRIFSEIVENHELPGLAVGIVQEDEIIYAQGFGVKSLLTQEPITTKSMFHMASVSKPFVATALMQLAEKGLIGLDDAVINHLPYFKIDDERYSQLTIKQMLTHTSGLPDVEDYEWDKPEYDDGSVERYVRSLTDKKLIFDPSKGFAYSNMAFEVLGDVISKVAGQPFEDYVEECILQPLGMHESTFLKAKVSEELSTTPHLNLFSTSVSDVYPYNRRHAASSTLHSNVLEICNWARANLNRGSFNASQILKSDSYDLLWKPHHQIDENNPSDFIGLSWFISTQRDHKIIRHGGGDIGYSTNLVLLPEKSIGIVTLCNTVQSPMQAIQNIILDSLLGYEVEVPKPSMKIPLGKVLLEHGLDAAIAEHRNLKTNHSEVYDFSTDPLLFFAWGLVYMKEYDKAINVIKLSLAADPELADQRDAHHVYDLLGEVYTKTRKNVLAIENYRKSLTLNPDNLVISRKLD